MYRKDSIAIGEWIKNSNKALLVTGARQIGKTWLIRDEIEKSGYTKFEVNFIDQPDMVSYLNVEMSAEDFLIKLKMIMPEDCKSHETVVFFDEIQKCPEIVTKIKFLVDEGSFKYVMSGSLLGVELKGIASAPVGYLTVLKMYPMDFEEFMMANNVSVTTLDMLNEKFKNASPVDEFVHQKLLSMFFVYLIVGGMPDAVKTYIETKDIREVDKVQRDITTLYKEDFSQYEIEDRKLKLKSIYDIIPAELNKQNKKFVFTMLDKELKFDRYENSFLWLKDAGVAIPVYNISEPKLPLIISENRNLFKLFFSDVGLLTSCYSNQVKLAILNKEKAINNGALFENVVAQELLAKRHKEYYFNSKQQGELDFVIELDGKVVPLEIKSGKDYKRHSALNNVLKNENYKIEEAYILSEGNIEIEGKRVYMPIYMIMFLENTELTNTIYKIDLDGLGE